MLAFIQLSSKSGVLRFIDGMPPLSIVIGPRNEQNIRLDNPQNHMEHGHKNLKLDSQVFKFKHALIQNFSLYCSIIVSCWSADNSLVPAVPVSPVFPSEKDSQQNA